MIRYLADKGHGILRNGYDVIPIQPGEKFPSVKGWRDKPTTFAMLDKWKANGRGGHGAGIKTDNTPFVDLDISNWALKQYMSGWCKKHIGPAPERIGNPPKSGLLYRCTTPFKKITSTDNSSLGSQNCPRWPRWDRFPPQTLRMIYCGF